MNSTSEVCPWQSGSYPEPQPTRCIVPGELTLDTIQWHTGGAIVAGAVGTQTFVVDVATSTLLDRRSFIQHLWRFQHALAICPSIEGWQEAIADAERRSA